MQDRTSAATERHLPHIGGFGVPMASLGSVAQQFVRAPCSLHMFCFSVVSFIAQASTLRRTLKLINPVRAIAKSVSLCLSVNHHSPTRICRLTGSQLDPRGELYLQAESLVDALNVEPKKPAAAAQKGGVARPASEEADLPITPTPEARLCFVFVRLIVLIWVFVCWFCVV